MQRTELRDLLPHQGAALWLDRLLTHDARSMRGIADWSCLATLGADASPDLLFETAAQLCAAHGALYAAASDCTVSAAADPRTEPPPTMALVGKVQTVRLHFHPAQRQGELAISVTQQAASAAGAQYTFAIHLQEQLLLDGSLLLVRADA